MCKGVIKMNILIYDANQEDLTHMVHIIDHYMSLQKQIIDYQIDSFHDINFSLDKIYDVAFICIDHENQFQKVKELFHNNPNCLITLLSYKRTYISQAFSCNVFQYIIKPYQDHFVIKELQRMLDTYLNRDFKFILHTNKGNILFKTKDIIYIETYYNQLKIVTENETYITNIKQKKALKQLLKNHHFLKIQRSYLVNILKIKNFTHLGVLLKNNTFLPASSQNRQQIKNQYHQFKTYKNI